METNELTEREQHYLNEWITHQEEKPIKTLMIITWLLVTSFSLVWGYMCFSSDYLTGLAIPVVLLLILACFTPLLVGRLKKHRTHVYNEIKRTKILSKEVGYFVNGKGVRIPVYYYRCQGMGGQIMPLSKKCYDLAKVGDDITVVMTSMKGLLGITFGKDSF